MKKFSYRIYKSVYDDMLIGRKIIEFRLLNEKTESIKIGDLIEFIVVDDITKSLLVEVLDKYIYENVDDLWNHKEVLNNPLNFNKEECREMFYNIFGKDNVLNSKIVGIKFKLIE